MRSMPAAYRAAGMHRDRNRRTKASRSLGLRAQLHRSQLDR